MHAIGILNNDKQPKHTYSFFFMKVRLNEVVLMKVRLEDHE